MHSQEYINNLYRPLCNLFISLAIIGTAPTLIKWLVYSKYEVIIFVLLL